MNKGEANEREKYELRKENKLALLIKKTYENTLANSTIFERNIGLCYFTSQHNCCRRLQFYSKPPQL